MSEIEYIAILSAIETIRETNNEAHDNIRELIHEGLKGVQTNINANAEVTNNRIDALTKRMDTNNGNVAKLQEASLKGAEVIKDFRKFEKDVKRNTKKWPYYLAGAVILILVVLVVYDTIGLRGIIELIP